VRGAASARDGDGLWGLCRNALPAPPSRDPLLADAARRDAEGLFALARLLLEWREALALAADGGGTVLTTSQWCAELEARLGATDVTLATPERGGVRVLEASAAVWQTYGHVFVVGMSAGAFPAEPTGRALFAEEEREALFGAGVPVEPARVWLAREASLFRALVCGARHGVHLSYAYADGDGARQLPSAYVDEVVSRFGAPGAQKPGAWVEEIAGSQVAPPSLDDAWCAADLRLLAAREWMRGAGDAAARDGALRAHVALRERSDAAHAGAPARSLLEHVLHAAGVEHARLADRRAPDQRPRDGRAWNGRVVSEDLLAALRARFGDAVWSASQLEAYGRCAFSFFGRYVLRAAALDEPDDDMDGATRGSLLHVCLERLHRALAERFGDDALTTPALEHAADLIPGVVARALDAFERDGRGGLAVLRGYREREMAELLRRYLQWEVAENEKAKGVRVPRRRPVAFELAFGTDGRPPVQLRHRHHPGRTLALRGVMDRVDEIVEEPARGWRYVVDHKSSGASLDPVALYEHGAILQLPLYLAALEQAGEGGAGAWGGAYQITDARKGGRRTAALHPRSISGGRIREGDTKTEQSAAAYIDDAVNHAFRHVDGVLRGAFPARIPSCSSACPGYCDYRDVCREETLPRSVPGR
jgi:hypothetical protein